MDDFVAALPAGLSSTPALVAYAITLVVVVWYMLRIGRLSALRGNVAALDGAARRDALVRGLGLRIGTRLDPDRVLRGRLIASRIAIALVLAATVATVVIATNNAVDDPSPVERLSEPVLEQPSEDQQADRAFLAAGPVLLAETGVDLRPRPSSEEIEAAVNEVALAGGGVSRQGAMRASLLRLGAFQRANADLVEAAARIDAEYADLATCYAEGDCRPGSLTPVLCAELDAIAADVAAINEAAAAVPQVVVEGVEIPGDDDAEPEVLFAGLRLVNVPALAAAACN